MSKVESIRTLLFIANRFRYTLVNHRNQRNTCTRSHGRCNRFWLVLGSGMIVLSIDCTRYHDPNCGTLLCRK